MSISNNLREAREEKAVSQADVGRALDADANTICRYESGRRIPTLETALRLSAYYHKTVNDLFQLKEN